MPSSTTNPPARSASIYLSKQINIDHREQCPLLIETLQKLGHEIRLEQLKLGDYHIAPDTIVERKTTDDFCLSIIDGRLFRQAYRLAEHTNNPIIIIEGESFSNRQHNIELTCIQGALISLAQTYRIPTLRTRNEEESAWYLHTLSTQRARVGTNTGVLNGRKPKRTRNQKINVLRGIPGVGPKLAVKLLDAFETIEAIATATQSELAKQPGVGQNKAQAIHSTLHEKCAPYTISPNATSPPRTKMPSHINP